MLPELPQLPADKPTARRAVRAARRRRLETTTSAGRRADAEALAGHLQPLLTQLRRGDVVASYTSLPTEPPTDAIHERVATLGLRLLLPVLLPDKDLDWSDGPDGPALGRDAIARARLLVVPALAVGRDGRRLGQGGGSYDRALVRRSPDSTVVSVVDPEWWVEQVPAERHDQAVDAVLTTQGLRRLDGA